MIITISGVKFQTTGKTLVAPKNKVVLSYLEAAKKGKGLAKKLLQNKTSKK